MITAAATLGVLSRVRFIKSPGHDLSDTSDSEGIWENNLIWFTYNKPEVLYVIPSHHSGTFATLPLEWQHSLAESAQLRFGGLFRPFLFGTETPSHPTLHASHEISAKLPCSGTSTKLLR
jgi:hypothetical protein